jgi:phosphate transport system protein
VELHFDQELTDLKERLLKLSALAETSVARSLQALLERAPALARQVVAEDEQLDRLQIEVDARSIELIALRQPRARDLRLVVMAMKISTDLERIGDQAVNIAHRVQEIPPGASLPTSKEIEAMGGIVRGMIRDSLDAFVYGRPTLAREVIARDELVDNYNRQVHNELMAGMIADSQIIRVSLCLMSVAHNLERIGDHTTNIAEEVVYLYEARDIRHQPPSTPP